MNRTTNRASRLLAAATAVAGMVALASPAHAFRMIQNFNSGRVTAGAQVGCNASGGFAHWRTSSIFWHHNTSGQGSGKAAALKAAMKSWTDVADASYVLTYEGITTAGWATDDLNTLLWGVDDECMGTCLALTALVLQQPGQVIVESDIIFNTDYPWNTDGTDFDTRAVAAHELGHSLGIHHTNVTSTPRPTMYASYFGTGGRSLQPDDQAALQCLQSRYPPGVPDYLDVASEFCQGFHRLEWAPASGATFYELYRSPSSTFSSQSLEYSGPGLTKFVNVSGTAYFRVRACDGSGCNGYRNGDQPAQYWTGPCL